MILSSPAGTAKEIQGQEKVQRSKPVGFSWGKALVPLPQFKSSVTRTSPSGRAAAQRFQNLIPTNGIKHNLRSSSSTVHSAGLSKLLDLSMSCPKGGKGAHIQPPAGDGFLPANPEVVHVPQQEPHPRLPFHFSITGPSSGGDRKGFLQMN